MTIGDALACGFLGFTICLYRYIELKYGPRA
jgi:hypothetical protein